MAQQKTTIERAFELAREGGCRTLSDIRRQLSQEGFSAPDAHTNGQSVKRQLLRLLRER